MWFSVFYVKGLLLLKIKSHEYTCNLRKKGPVNSLGGNKQKVPKTIHMLKEIKQQSN